MQPSMPLQLFLLLLLDLFLPQLRPVGPGLVDAEQGAFLVGVPARGKRPVGDPERRRAEGDEGREQRHPLRHLHPSPALERIVHAEQRHACRHGHAHREQDPPQDAVEHRLRQLVVVVVFAVAVFAIPLAGRLRERGLQHLLLLLLPLPQTLLLPLLLLAARLLLGAGRRVRARAVAGCV